ncbi:hypothetical protein N7528_001985 [Penicillium herquei]|nr:hypothetical protein N7528_001985 [Penicillium herquei]
MITIPVIAKLSLGPHRIVLARLDQVTHLLRDVFHFVPRYLSVQCVSWRKMPLQTRQARHRHRLKCQTVGKFASVNQLLAPRILTAHSVRLPQWEGVQRKWYYVQRATGKSQWDIPTEPVVLTPSTTPTSIGTGPSQAPPSRPSTNSPQASGLRGTLAERIEAVADSARTSVGNRAHYICTTISRVALMADPVLLVPPIGINIKEISTLVIRMVNPSMGIKAGILEYHPNPSGNMAIASSSYYSNNPNPTHMGGQQSLVGNPWTQTPNDLAAQGSGYNFQLHQGSYQNMPADPQLSHQMQAYPSTVMQDRQGPGPRADLNPPQPQWRTEQPHQRALQQSLPANTGTISPPQSFYPSNQSPQANDWSRGEFPPRSLESSNPSLQGSEYNNVLGPRSQTNNAQSSEYAMSRSHSHQAAYQQPVAHVHDSSAGLPSHGYSQQPPAPYSQYNNKHMAGVQSGTGFNSMVFPPTVGPQNSGQYYQNPLIQAGMHQYLAQQPAQQPSGSMPASNYPFQNASTGSQQHQWSTSDPRLSRTAASDPQFISGPWGSTPPS